MRIVRLKTAGGSEDYELRDGEARPLRSGLPPRAFQLADLLAPVRPTKIIGIARNYAAHAKELGNALPSAPLFFLKPNSAVIGPGEAIRLPPQSAEVHHEAELALVMGRRASRISPENALAHLLGITCLNDVTARDLQRQDQHFTRAKGFDTFCPIGPWIETVVPEGPLAVLCRVDGEVRQLGSTADLIFGFAELIAYLSHCLTLEPGDVIATGTPAGVGPLRAGQRVEVEVEGVGVLSNPVEAA